MYIVYRDKVFLTKPIDLVVQQIVSLLLLLWLHCSLGHSFRLFRPTRFNNIIFFLSAEQLHSICTIRSHIYNYHSIWDTHDEENNQCKQEQTFDNTDDNTNKNYGTTRRPTHYLGRPLCLFGTSRQKNRTLCCDSKIRQYRQEQEHDHP